MEYAAKILTELWGTIEAMAPYLLLGFGIAGILSVVISPKQVEKHLGGHRLASVIKASLFGVPLPLCSCSVIPVTASLRRHGAGRGATMAFLLSTPQTGVDSIMVTYALLGPAMALFRPLAAFITGIAGGISANLMPDTSPTPSTDTPVEESCSDGCSTTPIKHENVIVRILRHGFITLPRDVGKSMLIGVAVAGAITAFVPDDFLARYFGGGILSLLAMMLFGIPIYVCATASVPIAAALILKGVSPGAALVFLMTGPATNAAGIAAVWKMLGRGTVFIYLATTAVSALVSGLIFDRFMEIQPGILGEHSMDTMPAFLRTAFAVVLVIVLLAPSLPLRRKQTPTCCHSNTHNSDKT
jgi:uncharacterized membrane protein YraQ (UPF0718 family)